MFCPVWVGCVVGVFPSLAVGTVGAYISIHCFTCSLGLKLPALPSWHSDLTEQNGLLEAIAGPLPAVAATAASGFLLDQCSYFLPSTRSLSLPSTSRPPAPLTASSPSSLSARHAPLLSPHPIFAWHLPPTESSPSKPLVSAGKGRALISLTLSQHPMPSATVPPASKLAVH